ncbi:MAG: hypothetical protein Q7R87_00605 [Nanoarchaeota archaeon]|nr:hypothetical protein [Nanoarchaeota archaeon]
MNEGIKNLNIRKNSKLEFCKKELKILINKLIEGNYHLTAEAVYSHIANSGVDMDLNPKLRNSKTMKEFLKE